MTMMGVDKLLLLLYFGDQLLYLVHDGKKIHQKGFTRNGIQKFELEATKRKDGGKEGEHEEDLGRRFKKEQTKSPPEVKCPLTAARYFSDPMYACMHACKLVSPGGKKLGILYLVRYGMVWSPMKETQKINHSQS